MIINIILRKRERGRERERGGKTHAYNTIRIQYDTHLEVGREREGRERDREREEMELIITRAVTALSARRLA